MLDLNHVSMTFNPGTVNEKKALTDINLHMESGEFATIVGSNGAGKSTLFNAIAGSFIPDTGSILLDGVDMTFQPGFPPLQGDWPPVPGPAQRHCPQHDH